MNRVDALGKDTSVSNSKKIMVAFVVIASGLGGLLYGLDIGIIGGAIGLLEKEFSLSSIQVGWIVGAVLYGGAIALLVASYLADMFGRKNIIILSAIMFIVGTIGTSMGTGFVSILVYRFIMGVGVGVSCVLIPLYISETAPAKIRGRAVTCYQLFLTAGILLGYLIGLAYISAGDWRQMFFVLIIPGIIFLILSILIPESPVWHFSKGNIDKAKSILTKLNSESIANVIITDMLALNEERKSATNKSVFKKAYMVPFIIALIIAVCTQFTGINSFIAYAPTIFRASGVHSPIVSMYLGTIFTLLNFIVTIIAMFLIDKVGRKPLLTYSTAGIIIALIITAIISTQPASTFKIVVLCVGIFGFIICYAFGCGVVVWLAMSELLPSPIRSKGLAICLFFNCIASSVLGTVFPVVQEHIGYFGLFLILAGCTIIYFITAKFFLPETKGKTIEEIEEYWIHRYPIDKK